jgi:putative membrane protein
MSYDAIKALHIIFMVTWFAGLFYIVRLFIYQVEAEELPEEEKKVLIPYLQKIQRPLWFGITWPGMILTAAFGTTLFIMNPALLQQGFIHVKIALVTGLIAYHIHCHRIYKKQQQRIYPHSGLFMRYWNEVATIFLFLIVLVIVLKNNINWVYMAIGMAVLIALILWGVKAYKRRRSK